MRITQIDLENVKSYQWESVVFTKGTNAICGPNGAGKSTLVEAVGFALFDFLPTTHGQFVREGEKTATVTVHLQDSEGQAYQVVRKCGSSSQYYIYDPELGKLTTTKEETLNWLRDFMVVEASDNLSVLFRDAVGVPQGLLTAAFLDRPGNRRNTFNPLLRVEEYRKAWEELRGPCRHFERSIAEQEKHIAGFEAEVKVLPGWQQKATDLQGMIEIDERDRSTAEARLEEVTRRKESLEAIKERLDALERSVTQAEAAVKMLETQSKEAQAAVERAEEARSVVMETEAGHQAYLAAQANLDELEKQRRERDRLDEVLQEHMTGLALARQKAEGLKSELEAITEAKAEMEKLRPQVETQERLEGELAQARRIADRLAGARRNLEQERKRLADLEARLSDVQADLEELAGIEEEIETLKATLEALDQRRDALTGQVAAHQAELGQIDEQTAALEVVEAATCPVCEGPLTPDHRAELLARNRARREELETGLARVQAEQDEAEKARRQRQKALRTLENRTKKLPRPAEAEELAARIDTQRETVGEAETAVAEMAGAPAEVGRLEAELKDLGDPRRDYQRAADAAARREPVEKDLRATEERFAGLKERINTLEGELAGYAGLEERVETERAAQATHEPDHRRYLEHLREAKALGERQEKVVALGQELESARAGRDRIVEERNGVAAEYDAGAYAASVKEYDALHSEVAALGERLRQQRGQLAEAQAEIERLMGVQAELRATRAEHEELNDLLALLEHIRAVLRDAGPKVTQALVEVISLQAARLYADIMADHTARLRWTEDYEILLISGGRERNLQQLSGGEQMAAALAVRLALLKEVSAIDVAFFDEPTANLDERRRDNLAEQILNVKGFSQLFVISHDDTFERDTDNVVRIAKQDGVSQVVEV